MGQTAYYVDPPRLRVAGYVGGASNVIATFTVWLSREAGDQAAGEAARLTGDLGRLVSVLLPANLSGDDMNVHEAYTIDVQPRADVAVTVIGCLALSADWDEDA